MKFVLASVGSAGDAHPYIAVGHALRARGHEVAFFCNQEHQQAIEQAGLAYLPAGDGLTYAAAIANPNLWHPIKGMGVLWRNLLAPSIVPLYRTLAHWQQSQPGVRVLAGPQMLGARLAQEHLGVHLTTLYTSPGMLRSCIAPVTVAHSHWPRGTPSWLLQALWQAIDRYKLDPMARSTLQRLCSELGVTAPPARTSLFGQWMHSPARAVALFPEWFAPRKADYPAHMVYGGFAPYALDGHTDLPTDMQAFLQAGSAPVVVMFGTAMAHAGAQFAVWQQALAQQGLRGIFLSAHAPQPAASTAGHILHARYAPFAQLLPRAAALVHHGGIGSCVQALAAGIAQIIQPCAHDQFENARSVVALGAGAQLHRDANVAKAAATLKRWVPSGQHAALARCRTLSQAHTLGALCDVLESA
jgi:rhamnosyltransferase subunit B